MAFAESAVQLLFKENSRDDFLVASELLLRLAGNVLENPQESKYRRIRIANPLLESKLLPVVGGIECLFEMGFLEDGEYLTLPASSSLRVLRQVRDELSSLRTSLDSTASPGAGTSPAVATSQGVGTTPAATASPGVGTTQVATANTGVSTTPAAIANPDDGTTQVATANTGVGNLPAATASPGVCTTQVAAANTGVGNTPAATANPGVGTTQLATAITGVGNTLSTQASTAASARQGSRDAAAHMGDQSTGPQGGAAAVLPGPTRLPVQARPTQTVEDLRMKEADFLRRIQSSMSHVMLYEDPNLQHKARMTIPVAMLREKAEERLNCPASGDRNVCETNFDDCLVLELLDWFKKSFFQWVDSPPCDTCGGRTHHAGSATPTPAEEIWGGSRVENHQCDTCGVLTRFPRFNHPGKLLETRRGRCGEWANCFTLCCRALGFEARYVLDWTDHVWTEVYSVAQRRWLHCDPCENVCDKPLLYEKGWGKNLTYILAFSKDEVQDVTWRYSIKHRELLARRSECRETWLVGVVHNIFKHKLQSMPDSRRQEMLHRLVVELVEFVTIKKDSESLGGRTTGSVAWRLGRGELGRSAASQSSQRQYVFRLMEEEKHSEVVHIKYSCARDVYIRASSHSISTGKWHSCASSGSVFRKEESDWKMVYLARNEGADVGEICWKFDFSGEDLRINKVELKAASTVYENGVVKWRICSDDQCIPVEGSQLKDFMTFDLEGGHVLTITAVLSGGRGSVAWQHAQLFRQNLDDSDFPFEVILHLG